MASNAHPRFERVLMRASLSAAAAAMVFLSGCTMSSSAGIAPPLVLESSAQSHAALERAVASLLGRQVMLANDALTHDSTLVIDRVTHRDPTGRRIDAREDPGPEIFRLKMQGSECLLVRQRTQESVRLDNVRCIPAR
jgi:hypothetical protein